MNEQRTEITRTNGHIHGNPIRWRVGPSGQTNCRNLSAVVWVGTQVYMHCRPVDTGRACMGGELWRAQLRRELTKAEWELRKRVKRGA